MVKLTAVSRPSKQLPVICTPQELARRLIAVTCGFTFPENSLPCIEAPASAPSIQAPATVPSGSPNQQPETTSAPVEKLPVMPLAAPLLSGSKIHASIVQLRLGLRIQAVEAPFANMQQSRNEMQFEN